MEINLDKIKGFSAVTLIQLICGVIIPGYLFLFIYERDLFFTSDLFRLTAIAISITAPIFTINEFIIFILMIKGNKDKPKEDDFHRMFTSTIYLGSILTIFVFYSSIIIGYFFSLTLKQGLITIIISEISVIIIMIILELPDKKNKKQKA